MIVCIDHDVVSILRLFMHQLKKFKHPSMTIASISICYPKDVTNDTLRQVSFAIKKHDTTKKDDILIVPYRWDRLLSIRLDLDPSLLSFKPDYTICLTMDEQQTLEFIYRHDIRLHIDTMIQCKNDYMWWYLRQASANTTMITLKNDILDDTAYVDTLFTCHVIPYLSRLKVQTTTLTSWEDTNPYEYLVPN